MARTYVAAVYPEISSILTDIVNLYGKYNWSLDYTVPYLREMRSQKITDMITFFIYTGEDALTDDNTVLSNFGHYHEFTSQEDFEEKRNNISDD